MLTSLPLTVIDGAEKVVPGPATVSACQLLVPLKAQKNLKLLFWPWMAMLTAPWLTVIDGGVLAMAGTSPAAPNPSEAVAATARAAIPRYFWPGMRPRRPPEDRASFIFFSRISPSLADCLPR